MNASNKKFITDQTRLSAKGTERSSILTLSRRLVVRKQLLQPR